MSVFVAIAAALAFWCWMPAPGRLPAQAGGTSGAPVRRVPRTQVVRWVGPAVALVTSLVVVGLVGPGVVPLVVLGAGVVAVAWVLIVRARSQQQTKRRAEDVARGCQVLAGQLRIGQIPGQALVAAAEDCAVFYEAASAQAVGGGVPDALRRAARAPGQGGLESLAAAWQLAERSGAPMAGAADSVAEHLAQVASLRRSVSAELAPARATGKLLAVLPLIGIGMGFMVGGHPDEFLLGTTIGRWVLCTGVLLALAGLVWTEVLADRVERLTR